MAVDFEALDLVRSQNKSRSYSKRVDELQQQVNSVSDREASLDVLCCRQIIRRLRPNIRWAPGTLNMSDILTKAPGTKHAAGPTPSQRRTRF